MVAAKNTSLGVYRGYMRRYSATTRSTWMSTNCAFSSRAGNSSQPRVKLFGSLPRKARVSSRVLPITIGIAADCAGASGQNGCRGRYSPSITGPKYRRVSSTREKSRTLVASSSAAIGRARRRAIASGAAGSMSSVRRYSCARCVAARGPAAVTCWPLMVQALWNSPRAAGIAIRVAILAPPPDWPNTVTLPGSPPKRPMLSRTHCSANTRSSWPALPEANSSGPPIWPRCR